MFTYVILNVENGWSSFINIRSMCFVLPSLSKSITTPDNTLLPSFGTTCLCGKLVIKRSITSSVLFIPKMPS